MSNLRSMQESYGPHISSPNHVPSPTTSPGRHKKWRALRNGQHFGRTQLSLGNGSVPFPLVCRRVNCICVLQTWPAKGFCYRGSALRLLQPVATANKVVNASWQSAGTQTLAKVTSARTHTRPGHTPPINTHPNTHGLSRRHMSWSVNERAHLLGPSLSPAAMEN